MSDPQLRHTPWFCIVLGLLLLMPCLASAQTIELEGQTESGAFFKIMVPDGWEPANGLVIWNHGFDLSPVDRLDDIEDLGPLALLQLSEGYAVAASSYSLPGWAVFKTVEDNRQMVRIFEQNFGVPEQVLIYGASLGGLVTTQMVEQGGLGNVVGAFPFCGALAGSRSWDGAFDLRLLYDYVCGEVNGAALPGGSTGLPSFPDPNFGPIEVAQAVNVCTGVDLPANQRTPEQEARLAELVRLTQLPEEFISTDMQFATLGMADLLLSADKLAGGQALGNANVDYGDAAANAGIERITADPEARARFFQNYNPSGQVNDVKIVSIHTDKDGLVLVEQQGDYAGRAPSKNFSPAVVVEDEPSHCGFTVAELVGSWEALRAWVAGSEQPDAAQLQGFCQAVEGQGFPGPCRIDPSFITPSIDGRIRPRDACQPDATTLCLQDGRFRVQVNWRDFEDRTGPGFRVEAGTPDSGLLWFFEPDNWEVLVKVLNGCDINNHFWVFAAAATDVEYTITVTDTDIGSSKEYVNPLGMASPAITDTNAFATCP